MDIVTRIKSFISVKELAVSQFADTCQIPRPTVSQLLNGRNKKVSDEIISKIHNAYPSLSVNWLLFGEGDMFVSSGNIDSSSNNRSLENLNFEDDPMMICEDENLSNSNLVSESEDPVKYISSNSLSETPEFDVKKAILGNRNIESSNGNSERKVVNIIVFYSDNSFEYFRPAQK